MPGTRTPSTRRVVHKSTGGTLPSIPQPVDLVGNAARPSKTPPLTSLTVAHPALRADLSRQRERLFSVALSYDA
jgi:hypothetical protein